MDIGALLTRGTIWMALVLALAASCLLLRRADRADDAGKWLWTLACGFYVAHVAAAFHFYHGWSHAAAHADTARQTAAMTGWNWGGGIHVNYAFTALWVVDVLWWWLAAASHARRPRWITRGWHGFFLFVAFNATVVFGSPAARVVGVIGFVVLWFAWRKTLFLTGSQR
jgi:hypothetical protein